MSDSKRNRDLEQIKGKIKRSLNQDIDLNNLNKISNVWKNNNDSDNKNNLNSSTNQKENLKNIEEYQNNIKSVNKKYVDESSGYIKDYNKTPNPEYNKGNMIKKNRYSSNISSVINSDDKKTIDQSVSSGNIPIETINTLPSVTEENFKFGNVDFEDPTYLTFDIIMYTRQRALWDDGVGYGANVFLNRYSQLPRYKEKIEILKEFRKQLKTLFFTSDDEDIENLFNNNKFYYINTISGLKNLKKPIINYNEDRLTVTMNEDIKMKSEYIAELYNQLSYDYYNKREAIPESCLRFDMALIISDIRKFKISNSDNSSYENLNKSNVSREIFMLRDCNFDFSESYNIEEQITQSGFDASSINNSKLDFKIKFKSTERVLFADLFNEIGGYDALPLPTHNIIYQNEGKDGRHEEAYYRYKHELLYKSVKKDKRGEEEDPNNYKYNKKLKSNRSTLNINDEDLENMKSQRENTKEKRKEFEGYNSTDTLYNNDGSYFGDLLNTTKGKVFDTAGKTLTNYKNKLLQKGREKISEGLKNSEDLLYESLEQKSWGDYLSNPDIGYPHNVYSSNPNFEKLLQNFTSELTRDVTNDIVGEGLSFLG